MAISSNAMNLFTHYVHYSEIHKNQCVACNSRVKFVYTTAKHTFQDFSGSITERIRLYKCTNLFCPFHKRAFNPSPINVLPHKRYSLGVWKWIAQESKILKQSPIQIVDRIAKKFGIQMAENTIRDAINEIDVFLSKKIDEDTKKILKTQKKVLIALDGQKPDDEGNALWLFVDLISNRVLKVKILQSADSGTLHEIIEEIKSEYEVELIGGVSDKQKSITTMRDKFYSHIPWQYCHFHFLQNTWNHIEVKDGNLHKKWSKLIKDLYILTASKSRKVLFEGLGRMSVRDVFHELELQLRAILKARTKKFEHLRGVEVYDRVSSLVQEMECALEQEDDSRRIVKIMRKTLSKLKEGLEESYEQYTTCTELYKQFQVIRKHLGDETLGKEEKMRFVDADYKTIWESVKGQNEKKHIDQLRSFQPQKDIGKTVILQEWVRLYHSYRRGLYEYYDFPVKSKTNTPMEQAFGQQKASIVKQMGRKKVGGQIRIHGENKLKQIYAGQDKVEEIIDRLGTDYRKADLKKGLQKISNQTKRETLLWRNRVFQNHSLLKVLRKGKET